MRRRHLHRPIASLALVAMLLLSILPTLGRLAGEGTFSPTHSGAVPAGAHRTDADHMAHMAHVAHVAHAAHSGHSRSSIPAVPPPHDGHGSHDCPYCPLLAGLASLPVPMGLPASIRVADNVPWMRVANVPIALRTSSLGSRGPPTQEG